MLDRQTIELTMLSIAKKSGETLDGYLCHTIRTGVAQALQAKERHRQRMTSPEFKWQRPAERRNFRR